MTINTRMRFTILASAFALVIAAPAAFAQTSGTWYGKTHTDPATPEGVVTRHSKELMQRKGGSSMPAADQVQKSVELKDGSTAYFYKDGKMGMEDKFGRAVFMEPGHLMETKDGRKIIMIGNEVWRVDQMLSKYRIGG